MYSGAMPFMCNLHGQSLVIQLYSRVLQEQLSIHGEIMLFEFCCFMY